MVDGWIPPKFPPIEQLMKHGCQIVFGTDSYRSNWPLSIAKEMQAIRQHFPSIAHETILHWATASGASALRWENQLGAFEKGKQPGVVLLSDDWGSSKRLL